MSPKQRQAIDMIEQEYVILAKMKSVRRARHNLEHIQEKRKYQSSLLAKAKDEFIDSQPELAADLKLKVRPPNYRKRTLKVPEIDES